MAGCDASCSGIPARRPPSPSRRVLCPQPRARAAFALEALRYALFALAAGLGGLIFGASAAGLLFCVGLAPIVVALPMLAPRLRAVPRRRLKRIVLGRHWRIGRWMALMVLVSLAHEHVVTIAAGMMLGDWAAAGLRAGQILFGPILMLLMSLENFVPRQAAERLRAGGRPALAVYLRRVFLLGGLPVAGFCLTVAIFEDPLLHLLLGPAFTAFDEVVTVMAVAPTLILARELGMIYLRTVGETRGVFMAFAASSV